MKKIMVFILTIALVMLSVPSLAEGALTGNAQLVLDTVRWNNNLPKQSQVLHAEEYLLKMNKHVTLHTLLVEATVSEDTENFYGRQSHLLVIDLDTGNVIDYKNFNGDITWPDGDVTNKEDALHLLFNCYISYLEGWNEGIMDVDHEMIMPLTDSDIAAINEALTAIFVKSAE